MGEPQPRACTCIANQKEAKRSHPPWCSPKWSKHELKPTSVYEHNVCVKTYCNLKDKLIALLFASASEIRRYLKLNKMTSLVCGLNSIKSYIGNVHSPNAPNKHTELLNSSPVLQRFCLLSGLPMVERRL